MLSSPWRSRCELHPPHPRHNHNQAHFLETTAAAASHGRTHTHRCRRAHAGAVMCEQKKRERKKTTRGGGKTSHSTDPRHPRLLISKHTAGADRKPEMAPRGFQVESREDQNYTYQNVKNYFNPILQHWGITKNLLRWNHLFSWPNKYRNKTQSVILCMPGGPNSDFILIS